MRFSIFLMVCLLSGCSTKITEQDLPQLNGYWEITQVIFADGQTKDFMPSTTIDFIEVEGLEGFRKKVNPKLDGTFETSNDAKLFAIIKKEDAFHIRYAKEDLQTEESIEILTQLSDDNFSVMDAEGITYRYKRYIPLSIIE
jgi:hypothetical protein